MFSNQNRLRLPLPPQLTTQTSAVHVLEHIPEFNLHSPRYDLESLNTTPTPPPSRPISPKWQLTLKNMDKGLQLSLPSLPKQCPHVTVILNRKSMDLGAILIKAISVLNFAQIFLDTNFEKSVLNDTKVSLNTTRPKVPFICPNFTPFCSTLSYFHKLCNFTFSHWPQRYTSIFLRKL